jgi:poly [ADP-ribose] polymerase
MPHVIEEAKSGRASCRTCKQNIAKGELRFGEEAMNQFSDVPSLQWHHLKCAATSRPVQLEDTLAQHTGELADRAQLLETIAVAKKTGKPTEFPHADHAPTGRAKCIVCYQPIEKGSLRVAVERAVEGGGSYVGKSAAYLHPKCAAKAIEGGDVFARIKKNSPALEEEELKALEAELASSN